MRKIDGADSVILIIWYNQLARRYEIKGTSDNRRSCHRYPLFLLGSMESPFVLGRGGFN